MLSTNLDNNLTIPYNRGMRTIDRIALFPKPEDRDIYYAPSKIWSERLGIPLHYDWRIADHRALQAMVLEEPNRFDGSALVAHLYEILTTAFPKLLEIQTTPDSRQTLHYDVVLGCLSQFVFDDIKYFVEVGTYDRCPIQVSKKRAIEDRLNDEQFNWITAPTTLARIEAAIVW